MQSTGNRKKNKKKDCNTCPNHGLCAAEEDIPEYSCPIPDKKETEFPKTFLNKQFDYSGLFK